MKFLTLLLIITTIVVATIIGCETSEGVKYGTVQKVSHKKFPCSYYVIEIAYEGGRVETSDKGSSHSNTQEIAIEQGAYDSLQNYLGDKVIFDYSDKGFVMCGESKKLTMIKRK
jgi:hypothetical protein